MEAHHGLTVLDYTVLGTILLSGLLALMRGFVREMLSLAAWAAAYFVAAKFYPVAVPWTHEYIKNLTGANALAAVIIFIMALIVFTLVGYLIARLIRGRALTAIDRSLGFMFGLVRGVLIVCLLYLGATYVPWLNMDKLDKPNASEVVKEDNGTVVKEKEFDNPPEWLVYAKTRPGLNYGATMLKTFIPEKDIEETMKEYDKQRSAAQRDITEREHDIFSAPGATTKQEIAPAYDNRSRSNLNQLIDEKSKP
ncbi:MAG: CvpA family protein [Pseudomonadota bacterium]|nr:CvpA family protein [Pseudomonadota bacterium]